MEEPNYSENLAPTYQTTYRHLRNYTFGLSSVF